MFIDIVKLYNVVALWGKGGKQQAACMQCGKPPGNGVRLHKCSRCGTATYCGRECQRGHWRIHKAECVAKKAAAVGQN